MAQTDASRYPNGFLPFINSTVNDGSAVVGLRGKVFGFAADLSNTYGRNALAYNITNTLNASLPPGTSPASFYAGRLAFQQNTTNLGFTRKFIEAGPLATLNVAFGGEFRVDNFQIAAGDEGSYRNYQRAVVPATATTVATYAAGAGHSLCQCREHPHAGHRRCSQRAPPLGPDSRLTPTAAANFNETTVRSFNSSSFIDGNASLQNTLFDRAQRARLENGQSRSKINFSADHSYNIFGLSLRTVRFGEVQTKDPNPARSYIDQPFAAKWVTDLTLSAQLIKHIGLSLGVNNLFSIYPNRLYQDPNNNEQSLTYSTLDGTNRGRFPYNSNQFGFNGAFYFGRVNFTL